MSNSSRAKTNDTMCRLVPHIHDHVCAVPALICTEACTGSCCSSSTLACTILLRHCALRMRNSHIWEWHHVLRVRWLKIFIMSPVENYWYLKNYTMAQVKISTIYGLDLHEYVYRISWLWNAGQGTVRKKYVACLSWVWFQNGFISHVLSHQISFFFHEYQVHWKLR